jgi:SAM-dependent methyltransferase
LGAAMFEDEARATKEAVAEFFGTHTVPGLFSFRALCNGLKAAVLELALQELRVSRPTPRVRILDIGSGKGGDLVKWARCRPKAYTGVDVCADSVREATERHISLLKSGKIQTPAQFHCLDASTDALPCESEGVDVCSMQFSMQFMFATESTVEHSLREIGRVTAPGGIFAAVLPDGDRISFEITRTVAPSAVLGHFLFRKFEKTMEALRHNDPPVGIPYTFSLNAGPACMEYVVSPSFLEERLREQGFEGALPGGIFSANAQQFYYSHPKVSATVAALLKGKWCAGIDWESLLTFRVFVARKGGGSASMQSKPGEDGSAPVKGTPPAGAPRVKKEPRGRKRKTDATGVAPATTEQKGGVLHSKKIPQPTDTAWTLGGCSAAC